MRSCSDGEVSVVGVPGASVVGLPGPFSNPCRWMSAAADILSISPPSALLSASFAEPGGPAAPLSLLSEVDASLAE